MELPQLAPSGYSSDTCAICGDVLQLPPNEGEEVGYLVDDVELRCGSRQGVGGHHFHWSCITDWVKEGGDRSCCPVCTQNTLDQGGYFIVDIKNEGGFTGDFDLGRAIDEDLALDADPQERYNQAFLHMMESSNYEDASILLNEKGVDVNCTYPEGGQTAMHMAALHDDVEGVLFLVRNGARIDLRDEVGMTPLDAASSQNGQRVIEFLSHPET
ncbi:hypothetical protein BJ138DRAFT_1146095 [Hygrophoropsis aurantiaca]|uniref:Uncharacterized protein n=1 Tax=Hygrophoropsis aurantiaca TaxID=72124 RepID=A0ACB8AJY2_9AGAM|nr:hypothetical protein BJ138DRAFT_1146095 [Hygrophoropsis aurantiaca]